MIEWKNIIDLYDQAKSENRKSVLATVVRIKGSSYRSTGSRMLILDDGRWAGTISGGCLEKDARVQASRVMTFGKPELVTYDSTRDSDQVFMANIGCNGVIDVLYEPLQEEDDNITFLKSFLDWTSTGVLAKVFESEDNELMSPGARMLLTETGKVSSSGIHQMLKAEMLADMHLTLKKGKSYNRSYHLQNKKFNILFELVHPPLHLFIFGDGHDVYPLLDFADKLGWKASIFATKKHKAHTAELTCSTKVTRLEHGDITDQFTFGPYSAAILMSHNYELDFSILKKLLPTEVPYIGMLGPKKRALEMFDQLNMKNNLENNQLFSKVHAPVGLDIGAENSIEIAMAVTSEILAFFRGHNSQPLKDKEGPIHHRTEEKDVEHRQQFLN